MTTRLPDDADRARIRDDTASTLFVNAGAGSGKTSALVERITTLVLRDGEPMARIAAVTFTDKAGAELRDRLRAAFERHWRNAPDPSPAREKAAAALDDLDGAAIGTLHSFAQRILTGHPVEARLPPALEILDEVGSGVASDDRWTALRAELLDDDGIAGPLLLGLAAGLRLEDIRSLVVALGRDWDLIPERVLAAPPPPVRMPDLTDWTRAAREVADLADACTEVEDKLLPRLTDLQHLLDRLDRAVDDGGRVTVLRQATGLKFSFGRAGHWTVPVQEVRESGRQLVQQATELLAGLVDVVLRNLTVWAAQRVLDAAEERRREGRLEFHDLLVLARDLLRHDPGVRADLHDRYRRLLLDEFQDTDPIQIELAVRIAGGTAAAQVAWQDVHVPDGRLFVVGDAKQSIYRFRRASIGTYLQAQDRIGDQASLSTNFRTVAPVVDWVNSVFGALIQASDDAQPAYDALTPVRQPPADVDPGPAVTLLGTEAHTGPPRVSAAVLRAREAADVAAVVARALADRWQVQDPSDGAWRDVRPGDIAVLVPARTSLRDLEHALDRAGLPHRTEATSLVYQSQEVRDLLACARAVADSSDELSLVTALRSPLFGCGDDDLWNWRHAGGRLNLYANLPGGSAQEVAAGGGSDPGTDGDDRTPDDDPVGAALTWLQELAREARWQTPSQTLDRIVAGRRMMETAALFDRPREAWRRLRFVVDQARASSETEHGGLRGYLAWAAHQGQETTRVAEAVLPETDSDAVRVMTVHAAKGLEFPVVVMSGMTSRSNPPRGLRLLWPPDGGYQVRVGGDVQTSDFDAAAPVDEQMGALERHRLLYVAATRARDHLIVSLHRADGSTASTAAASLAGAGAVTAGHAWRYYPTDRQLPHPATAPVRVVDAPDLQAWQEMITRVRDRAAEPAAVSASGLEGTEPAVALAERDPAADGAAKGPRDLGLPPWSKGRYGSDIGRAVHAVLQVVNLAGDGADDVDALAAAQAVAEGVTGHTGLVADLVRSALGAEVVVRAAAREHWRETYVGTVLADGTALEGYVDLVYREDDGSLRIVDYKTDAVPAGALDSRVTYYRPQMRAYRDCLAAATGARVGATLLFLHPDGAVARPLPDLDIDPARGARSADRPAPG